MFWDDFDMEYERSKADRKVPAKSEGPGPLTKRIEELQRCLREGEDSRREEWEKLEGRLMTAEEKRQLENDHIQRVLALMNDAFTESIRAANDDIRRMWAETRAEAREKFEELLAESRAQRQATLQMLDRLPPAKEEEN